MIRTLVARFLARLGSKCDRAATRLYRIQSGIDARRAMARLTENHTASPDRHVTRLDITYAHHAPDEGHRR